LSIDAHLLENFDLTTRSTATNDGIVILEIGPQKQHYHLHKALLTHHSEYFNKALNGPWKESKEKAVTLDDVDTIAVDIFVHWLYTQQIPDNRDTLQMTRRFGSDPGDDDGPITGYTKALVFGDRFLVPAFRQAVHNCLVDTLLREDGPRCPTFFTATKYALENLPSNHSILELFMDIHCRYWSVSGHGEYYGGEWGEESGITVLLTRDLPSILLIRIIARYSWRAVDGDPDWWNLDLKDCDYHEHLDDQERKDCEAKSEKKLRNACQTR